MVEGVPTKHHYDFITIRGKIASNNNWSIFALSITVYHFLVQVFMNYRAYVLYDDVTRSLTF